MASTWKAEVTAMSAKGIPIRKSNFIECYARARAKAFSQETILSAWRKTGISPLDINAIPKSAFAPALNTTTKPALPVGVELPSLLERVPSPMGDAQPPTDAPLESISHTGPPPPSHLSPTTSAPPPSTASQLSTMTAASGSFGELALTDNETWAKISAGQLYHIVGLPSQTSIKSTKEDLVAENRTLRDIIDRCCYQMQRDYALKKLMEDENGKLREQLFTKQLKPKKKQTTAYARHMTGEECMDALAMEDWKTAMRTVFATGEFKAQKKKIEAECRRVETEARDAEKQLERDRKAEEKREKEAQRDAERAERAEKARQKKEEAERKKKEKEEERKRKQAEAAAKKVATGTKKRGGRRDEEEDEDNTAPATPEPRTPPRSRLQTPTISSAARARPPATPKTPLHIPKARPVRSKPAVGMGSRGIDEVFIIRRSGRLRAI